MISGYIWLFMKFQYDIVGILMGISCVSSMISLLHAFFTFGCELSGILGVWPSSSMVNSKIWNQQPQKAQKVGRTSDCAKVSAPLYFTNLNSLNISQLWRLWPPHSSLITNLKIRRSSPKTTLMTLDHQTSASFGDFDPPHSSLI